MADEALPGYFKRQRSVRYPIIQRDGVVGRVCRDCSEFKPLSEFYRITGRRDHAEYLTRCKPCHITVSGRASRNRWRDAEWHAANAARRNLRRTAMKYHIPEAELQEMWRAGCRICGSDANLHIDHDHGTGITRGVLCRLCNVGLGHFRDNPELLAAAIQYLTEVEAMTPRPPLPRLPPGRRRVLEETA